MQLPPTASRNTEAICAIADSQEVVARHLKREVSCYQLVSHPEFSAERRRKVEHSIIRQRILGERVFINFFLVWFLVGVRRRYEGIGFARTMQAQA